VKEEFRKEFSDIDFSVYSSIAGELDFVKEFDGENWILTIDIPEGLKNLRITILPDNIQVVPEFGIIAVLIFAVSIGTLIMLNKKRI
jgi:predicted secreted protein with PEFG-CTERM motif